ncbi:MAG TPA: hypothetical protein VIU15_47440 [Streptomyces sp.]
MRSLPRSIKASGMIATTLLLTALGGTAFAAPQPLPITNGNFANPTVAAGPQSYLTNAVPGWNVTTETYSTQMCQRSDQLQCLDLNGGGPVTARQTLTGVKAGDAVVVTFGVSPNTWAGCTVAQLQDGQPLRVSATGSPSQLVSADPVSTTQTAKWRDVVYSFTATQDNPSLSFTPPWRAMPLRPAARQRPGHQ